MVPAADVQTLGPEYDFRISQFEITNEQFLTFLNDALNNLDNERGQYMFFDVASDDVYIHNQVLGQTGVNGSGTLMFDASENGALRFEAGQYVFINANLASHPVSGVTWYGAVKYCNWLTIESGLPLDQRIYTEASSTSVNAWHPITITTAAWATRDLNEQERLDLLDVLGFRLPMDAGQAEVNPYNEWFKVASARRLVDDTVVFDVMFGFGRDTILAADANYINSSDPFEPGTSPVGYFDGINASTNDTENAYLLYDLSGNVWEWMQDQSPGDPTRRRNRGGSWESEPSSLGAATGEPRLASSAVSSTGFRIVQSVLGDLIVTPFDDHSASGLWGGPYDDPLSVNVTYRLQNVTNEAVSFTVSSDQLWLTIEPVSGTIEPASSLEIIVTIDPVCSDGLKIGVNEATLTINRTIIDLPDILITERLIQLTVREPLTITPTIAFTSEMSVGGTPTPANLIYKIISESNTDNNWSIRWEETTTLPSKLPWLTINNSPQSTGTVQSQGESSIDIAIDQIVAADLEEGIYTATVTFINDCTQTEFTRSVTLTINIPFNVTPVDEVVSTGLVGGPFDPTTTTYTITNNVNHLVNWNIQLCTEPLDSATCTAPLPEMLWLELETANGTLSQDESFEIISNILPLADTLDANEYPVTLRFEDVDSGFFIERLITLDVTGLRVTPEDEIEFLGPLGGPFEPANVQYTLQNTGLTKLNWIATIQLAPLPLPLEGIAWLEVTPDFGVIIDPDGADVVTVNPSDEAALLIPGEYLADIVFTPNGDAGAATTRPVKLVVGNEGFSLPMVLVPASDVQLAGPSYDFRVGKFEVTNEDYARFLNVAQRHTTDVLGQYLYHDTSTGSVYINNAVDGVIGTGGLPIDVSIYIYNATHGQISYDPDLFNPYVVKAGYNNHPVTGVSWYGAVKFCNWVTLIQQMPAEARVYHEIASPDLWTAKTFNPSILAENLVGFRLLMDDTEATSSPFNEWYKAASRGGVNTSGEATFGAIYGFGRNVLNAADANYLNNEDTAVNGTTPIGFFDGFNLMFNGSSTSNTSNGYNMYDVCGNVAEWIHDLDTTGLTPFGATRGGNFNLDSAFNQLRTDTREELRADDTFSFIGFRIAQSLTPVPFRVSQADTEFRAEGIVGGPYSLFAPEQSAFLILMHNDAFYTLDNMSINITNSGGWLEFNGLPPSQIPPDSTRELTIRLSESIDDILISPIAPGNMKLVSGRDDLPGGPTYDYWISTTEVTNSQFASFLTNAIRNARAAEDNDDPQPRSDYLYFDTDSGSVYINDTRKASIGTAAPSASINTLLYDSTRGRISYTPPPTDQFAAAPEFENHPVVGVTWYGALKYCNWLTVNNGLPDAVRAYSEDTTPQGWHPATIDTTSWLTRDLNETERLYLIRNTLGYRLPMDQGGNNLDAAIDAADLYNEWYKAAIYRIDENGFPLFDALYGFGRSTLTGADANFDNSGDTQLDGTTAVEFFNGLNLLFDGETETNGTDNVHRLYDMTGNVAEWMQDFYVETDPTSRSIRGGGWTDAAGTVLQNTSRSFLAPDQSNDHTGFRVVRGTGHLATITMQDRISDTSEKRYIMLDLREPLVVGPPLLQSYQGFFCDDLTEKNLTFSVINTSDMEIPWSVTVDQNWVTLAGPVPGEFSGNLAGGASAQIQISATTNNSANDLLPGEYTAKVRLIDNHTTELFTRELKLTIDPSITVTSTEPEPSYEGFWLGPFTGTTDLSYSLERIADCELDYTITTPDAWLTLAPEEDLAGTLPPVGQTVNVQVNLNDEIAIALNPGEYEGKVVFTLIDPINGPLPVPVEKTIVLNIKDPVQIGPGPIQWDIGCDVDALENPIQTYELTNHHATASIGMHISTNVGWINIDTPLLSILPSQIKNVTFTINDSVPQIPGEYPVTLSFTDTLTEFTQTRDVIVVIGDTHCVTPLENFVMSGPVGGSVQPNLKIYTIRNASSDKPKTVTWTVSTDVTWVKIQDQSLLEITLQDGDSAGISLTVDETGLPTLSPGVQQETFNGLVTFTASTTDTTPTTVQRRLRLTLVNSETNLIASIIPASATEPGGPEYPYFMGPFHTTHEEFIIFLNDALLHLDNPRGEYMFFNSTTGDVYINNIRFGETGPDAGARTLLIFSTAASGHIEFVNGVYQIVPDATDFSTHPATGVSWYGAVKYCNWLTLDQGMLPDQRCYTEDNAQNPDGWHPVTISTSDWQSRDLNDEERDDLVKNYRGFRLPMDDGYNNLDSIVDAPDNYNEWYKAAAWKWDEVNQTGVHTVYGFGRDTITSADANYLDSGDPFEPVSSPVGYYDSLNPSTNDTENAYHLYDMTGNVHQWIQGQFAPSTSGDRRALRGGSFNDPVGSESLRNNDRPRFARPSLAHVQIGFRVLRTLAPTIANCIVGPDGTLPPGCETFDLNNDGTADLLDFSMLQLQFTP